MYISYFRSTDTSEDPQGQLYKVVFLNDNASYPYAGSYNIPQDATEELTMATEPFIVTYEANNDNVYKPYKCSRASIKVFLSHLYLDLIPKKKNSIKILLLKRKNDVKLISLPGLEYYVNETTQERLRKKVITNSHGIVLYDDFEPREKDSFCYDVEWQGYLTPTSSNQSFDNPQNAYEMEAQDSLSSLKYFDFDPFEYIERNSLDKNAVTMIHAITAAMQPIIDDYKEIYITNTTHVRSRITNPGQSQLTILDQGIVQTRNFFDEEGQATDSLSVIENIMTYLNLTMVPWKDRIYIINYDAIINERCIYQKYTNDYNGYTLDTHTYTEGMAMEELNDAWAHQISYSTTYKEVEVKVDEYEIKENVPDITQLLTSTRRFQWDTITSIRQPREQTGGVLSRKFYYDIVKIHYSGEIYENPANVETYHFIQDNVSTDSQNFQNATWSQTTTTPATSLSQLTWKVGCDIINFGTNEYDDELSLSSIITSYPSNYAYYFHTMNSTLQRDDNTGRTPGWQSKYRMIEGTQPPMVQPLLKITTKPALISNKDSLHIKGDITFFNNVIPTANNWKRDLAHTYFSQNPKYSYIWVKIKCLKTNRYLVNSDNYTYTWRPAEAWCKLYYSAPGYIKTKKYSTWSIWGRDNWNEAESDAFENTFSFIKNTRRYDGLVIPLANLFSTDSAFVTEFEITFNRPTGCAVTDQTSSNYDIHQLCPAQSTILQNFDVQLVTTASTTEPPSNDQQNDSSFKIKMEKDALEDFDAINVNLSSGLNMQPTQSAVNWRIKYNYLSTGTFKGEYIVNEGNGYYGLPESNIVSTIANQYKEPRQGLQCTTTRYITPLNSYWWRHSAPNNYGDVTIYPAYVVNSMVIDYAYNEKTLNLVEIKRTVSDTQTTTYRQIRKNFDRAGNNLFSEKINSTPKELNIILQSDNVTTAVINTASGEVFINNGLDRPANDNSFEVLIERGELFFNRHNLSTATAEIENNYLYLNV